VAAWCGIAVLLPSYFLLLTFVGGILLAPVANRMNEITDSALLSALGRQMTQAVARQVVAAGNLANLDTPGYRTRDVPFADVLAGEMGGSPLVATSPAHLAGSITDAAKTAETAELPSRRDGNNVQLDRELLNMTRASSDFAAAQTVLAAKFRLIRYAINEGR
jgi:flagellar basal-body rod protein FlgB